jgi:hypothetical protein
VVQVVRCSILSGRCERAGAAQEVRVTSTMWDSTALGFVDQ